LDRWVDSAGLQNAPPDGVAPVCDRWPHQLWCLVVTLNVCLFPALALAQRAGENAVTAAEDAFGTATGSQTIGLYSITDARGFNPQQAGNLRIEGLFFDQPSMYLNQCLVSTTTMRVGIAAQSYSFPAPTGIVDIKLSNPQASPGVSAVLGGGSYGQFSTLLEGRGQVSERVSAFACAAYEGNFIPDQALRARNATVATVWSWHPTERTDVRPFLSYVAGSDHQVLPIVYTDGVFPPPLFAARDLASQEFTDQLWRSTTLGVLVRQSFDTPWVVSAGMFRAIEHDPTTFEEEYLSVLPDRSADHVLDVVPSLRATSDSGEVLVARRFGGDGHTRTVQLMLRGRRSSRDFGGDALVEYGAITLESPPPPGPMPYMTSAVSVDETRQLDVGAQYQEQWQGVGSLGVGLLRSHYRRTLLPPQPGSASSKSAAPWLTNLRASFDLTSAAKVYGSYVQGLEDSALAPSTATNRGEPPPATRSRQADFGIRYARTESLSVILGLFDIKKSYFNLDTDDVYTAIGTVRHRGVESSVTYSNGGFTLVAGGVLLKQHVDRALTEADATGLQTIGPVPLTLNFNLDCAPPSWQPWAASIQLTRWSSRVATNNDLYWLPPLVTLAAGVRYEARVAAHPLSLRLDVMNVTDARGLHLTELGQITPELDRRFLMTVAFDY
jgi:iron complex outermembrane receptor protein